MGKRELRNLLTGLEDEARHMRNITNIHEPREKQIWNMFTNLIQLIREEIVK